MCRTPRPSAILLSTGSSSDRLALALVPLHRAAQAVFKVHQNLVSQVGLRLRDVGQRMFDVPTTLWSVLDGASVSSQFLQSVESFIQGGALSGGAIKNAAGTLRRRRRTGERVGRHGVVDIGEIAAGFAVAKNRRLFPTQHLHAEFRKYARVCRRRILPWPENIEVPQTDSFEAVATVERHHVKLARQLGHCVGRDRVWDHGFMLRKCRSVAISRR